MSKSRRDPRKAKQRRDRIRRDKQAQREASFPEPASENSPEPLHSAMAEPSVAEDLDDPKLRAWRFVEDALEAEGLEEALYFIRTALDLDPDSADAQRLEVTLLPLGLENQIKLMRGVADRAGWLLGERFFANEQGRFWATAPTRPYMRAMLCLGELLAGAGRLREAIVVFERMIELNPDDNQGVRYPLLDLYLAEASIEGADSVLSRYAGEAARSGMLAWARVLKLWLAGEEAGARAALRRARRLNRSAEGYVSGVEESPEPRPARYKPGDESEAEVWAAQMRVAWRSHPEFQIWLRQQT